MLPALWCGQDVDQAIGPGAEYKIRFSLQAVQSSSVETGFPNPFGLFFHAIVVVVVVVVVAVVGHIDAVPPISARMEATHSTTA